MALKAFLFDLDGTLIDSERFHYNCWEEMLGKFGISINYEDWIRNYAGIPLPVNARTLVEKYAIPMPLEEFTKEREALTLTRLKTTDIGMMPYAIEFLDFLVARKLRISLVTSSPADDVTLILSKTGLKKYFEQIITRTDVTHSKPDPESYLVCARKMNVDVKDCIAFEDTLNGTRSAKAAGMICYAIQVNSADKEKLSVADHVFADFELSRVSLLESGLIDS